EYGMISQSGCGFGVNPTPCYGTIEFSGEEKIKTSVMHFMLSGRATINPDSRVRFYIPMGIGLARNNVTIDSVYSIHTSLEDVTENAHIKSHKTGFSWYIGGGVEATIYKNIWLGIEGRYSQFDLKITGVEGTYHPHYFTAVAKIGYKF
ncbi:MAG: outer membrane beta-barrel protein, partial [Elusimicrobiaceae bacterium]|nr:outer membrane beta-barrel protein [Elusimicrobiaceae bacterium]